MGKGQIQILGNEWDWGTCYEIPKRINKNMLIKKHLTFVFWGLGNFTWYNLFQFHSFTCNFIISIFFLAVYLSEYVCHIFTIHLSVDVHLGWVNFLGDVNEVTMSMDVQVSL